MLPKLGRYETLKKIASGGMATVYLGRVVGEGGFERLVALKVMHPHIAGDPDFVGMFLDEARLAARIRHPNVVATIDVQKTNDAMFIVMDYVDGPTLQEVRKHLKAREERVPIGIALRFFIDILNGLQEAHELCDNDGRTLNLVHRDVSPHNILIGQDGRAQLTDFGVAKAEARISSTRGGQLKGKIAYMPPEQIIAQPVDRRADVYSAGVCLWECLVGKRLFRAANDGALVHMILEGNPTPPSKYCDDIPAAIEGVLMKAISRKPEGRYDEAVDFAEALEDAARESKIKIPRQRSVGRFIKEIVGEIGRIPVSKRSLTPPSVPSGRSAPIAGPGLSAPIVGPGLSGPRPSGPGLSGPGLSAPIAGPGLSGPGLSGPGLSGPGPAMITGPSGVSAPSMPSMASGPSLPQPMRQMPVRAPLKAPHGPPPIPDIGSDPAFAPPRPPPPKASSPVAQVTGPPLAPLPKKSAPDVLERPPITFDEIEDPPTDVIAPGQSMADLVNSSQPSAVTSPTQTEVSYSLAPPPSRHGIIAVAVAGAFLLMVLVAVMAGSPDSESSSVLDPAPPAAETGAESPPTPTAPPAPDPEPPASSSAPESADPAPTPAGTPVTVPNPGKRRRTSPASPKPDPAPFKPKTL